MSPNEFESYLLSLDNPTDVLKVLDHYYNKTDMTETKSKDGNFVCVSELYDSFLSTAQKNKFDLVINKLNIHKKCVLEKTVVPVEYYINYKPNNMISFENMIMFYGMQDHRKEIYVIVPFHHTLVEKKTDHYGMFSYSHLLKTEQIERNTYETPLFGVPVKLNIKNKSCEHMEYSTTTIEKINV